MERKLKDVSTILSVYEKRRQRVGKTCSRWVIQNLSLKLMSALNSSLSNNANISLFEVPEPTTLCDMENISLATCIISVKDDLNQENYKRIMNHICKKWVKNEDCSIIKLTRTKLSQYTVYTISDTDHIILVESSIREKNREKLDYLRDLKAIHDLINSDHTLSDIEREEYAEIIYMEQQEQALKFQRKRHREEQTLSSANSSPISTSNPLPSYISRQIKIEDDLLDTTESNSVSTLVLPSPPLFSSKIRTEGAFLEYSDADSASTVECNVSIHSHQENNTKGMDDFKISRTILHLINTDATVSDIESHEYAEIINTQLNEQNNSVTHRNSIKGENVTATATTGIGSLNGEKKTKRAEGSLFSQQKTKPTETITTIKKEIQDSETDYRTIQFKEAFQHLNSLSHFVRQQRNRRACYLIKEITKELLHDFES